MKKTGIGKKLFSLCFAAMVIASVGGTVALANNYHDTAFNFAFDGGRADDEYTEARAKEDDSSMYIYCKSSNWNFTVHSFGRTYDGRTINCAYGKKAYVFIKQGTKDTVTNKVNESGYPYGGLVGHSDGSAPYDWSASGVWSPDKLYG